jgi:hypothetical protein
MDDIAKKEKMQEFLNEVLIELPRLLRRPVSQNEIAVLLHVDGVSFSQWSNKQRLPAGKNIYRLGESLRKYKEEWAEDYYRILDVPSPVIPADLRELVQWWGKENTTDAQRKAITEIIKNELDVLGGLDGKRKGKDK